VRPKRILLFGKYGQLGSYLYQLLHDEELTAVDYPEVDFNHPDTVAALIDTVHPDLIINAVAYTDVDGAEKAQPSAFQVNGHTVGVIAQRAKKIGAGFIHYSTDYVFDGQKGSAYHEKDSPNPVNIYGESKLLGEERTIAAGGSYLIFRLSWVYTVEKPSFVTKVLQWSRQQETVRIVDDQISSPTWAFDVARFTTQIVKSLSAPWYQSIAAHKGLYHLAGTGAVSRYEWGKTTLDLDPRKSEQKCTAVLPAKTHEFPSPAPRPPYSALDSSKFQHTFELTIPHWRDSLAAAIENIPQP
jgi:dTDP-4-dehydrorhamnose reductase